MNQKELNELRRRFRADRSAISRVYGCYVNGSGEIISYIDSSLGAMPQDESEKYLGLLKKSLSGTLGKNLIDIVFSTRQVADSEEHRLLMSLRDSGLADSARSAAEAKAAALAAGEEVDGEKGMGKDDGPAITQESLTKDYPLFASSLMNLVQSSEVRMGVRQKR